MGTSTYLDRKTDREIEHVVVVYPYTYVNPYNCMPPIGAEYLQAGAVKAGRRTTLLDMRFEDDVAEQLADADLVCFYGFFEDCSLFGKWHIHVIEETLAKVPDHIPVLAGGTGFGDDEETLEKYPRIDAVMLKAMSLIASGANTRSCNTSPRRLPRNASTTLPTQSIPQP